eukprot:768379-Hanusia_phi.AAC.5
MLVSTSQRPFAQFYLGVFVGILASVSLSSLFQQGSEGIVSTIIARQRSSPVGAGDDMMFPNDAICVGHLSPDLDSVAASIAACELYGGTPAAVGPLNSETRFALRHWGATAPSTLEDLQQKQGEGAGMKYLLIDFQQTTQLHPSIARNAVVGVIDHHALQSQTLVTSKAIPVQIKPWGSSCTILAFDFFSRKLRPKTSTMGLMLSAILSDTLNLRSPTTTPWDRKMAHILAEQTGNKSLDELARLQFKAKSQELAAMDPEHLITNDVKEFEIDGKRFRGKLAISVIETTDPEPVLDRVESLRSTMGKMKADRGVEIMLVFVVDIVKMNSVAVVLGEEERSLVMASFSGAKEKASHLIDIGGRVSRKSDMVPPITKAIVYDEWSFHPTSHREL